MYAYEIRTGYKSQGQWADEQKPIEFVYPYETRDEAREAAIKRCLQLQTPASLPVYKLIVC
jgi:hypothetical protein